MPKIRNYAEQFMPIDPDYTEIIEEYISLKKCGKVNFFNEFGKIDGTSEGVGIELQSSPKGVFLLLSCGDIVRVDKIITLMGRPGPAYEAYDRYANACLTCEDLNQF